MSRYLILCLLCAGCAQSSAEDRARERYRSVVRETVEAPPAAPDLAPRLDDLESRVAALEASVAVLSLAPDPVPQSEPEPTPAPPKAEIVEAPKVVKSRRMIRVRGNDEAVEDILAGWYRADSGYHAPRGEDLWKHCVQDHGVEFETIRGLDYATVAKLHVALHRREDATPRVQAYSSISVTRQNCPPGTVCPVPQSSWAQRRAVRRSVRGR